MAHQRANGEAEDHGEVPARSHLHRLADLALTYLPATRALAVQIALLIVAYKLVTYVDAAQARLAATPVNAAGPDTHTGTQQVEVNETPPLRPLEVPVTFSAGPSAEWQKRLSALLPHEVKLRVLPLSGERPPTRDAGSAGRRPVFASDTPPSAKASPPTAPAPAHTPPADCARSGGDRATGSGHGTTGPDALPLRVRGRALDVRSGGAGP